MEVFKPKYIVLILILSVLKANGQDIKTLLPSVQDLPGWTYSQEPEVFTGDELFELIDGGADIYLEYGFKQVVSAQLTDPSQNNIQAEIYEMNDDAAAYGIFSITQQMVAWTRTYGTLSSVADDYISFWKGDYYVNISWSSRQHLDQPLLASLAGIIAGKIADEGKVPAIVNDFAGTDTNSRLVYLKGNLGLSNFYYFDYKDDFFLQEAVAWTSGAYHTIVIKYPDPSAAIENITGVKTAFSANKRFTDIVSTFQGFSCNDNKGNLILLRQIENYIAIEVGLMPDISLVPLLDEVSVQIEHIKN
jgi:hypothetical protein